MRPGTHPPLSVTVVTAVDPVLRDVTALGALTDVPDTVVVRHDVSQVAHDGFLRRMVSDTRGLLEDVLVPLAHPCLSCALREDLLPTLARLAATGRWSAAVLALPVASEPVPVVRALDASTTGGPVVHPSVQLAGVVCVVDGPSTVTDLVGPDLLAERYLAHGRDDRRSLGEVLAHQLRAADLVLATGTATTSPGHRARVRTALAHLSAPGALRVGEVEDLPGGRLLAARHDPAASRRWEDPRHVAPSGAGDGHGVWTLDLADWRPLHPGRLMGHLEELACGALVGRGRFWLPTRPGAVGTWDGAGGQLSLGHCGPWGACAPSTRLVVTGMGESRERVRSAFTACLLTDAELAAGLDRWVGAEDGFDHWLGARDRAPGDVA